MGEYYKPFNVTRREYIHPHRMGDGLKYNEWVVFPDSGTNRGVAALIASGRWSESDDIRIASDYGSQEQMHGEASGALDYEYACDHWTDVSALAVTIMEASA